MDKHVISWITADYFIDVDLPIVPVLARRYQINWFVCLSKSSTINYEPYVNRSLKNKGNVNLNFVYLKRRFRNPLLILEYLSIILKAKKQNPDLYYIDFLGIPYFFPLLKLLVGAKKVIVATHNVSTPKGAISHRFADLYMRFIILAFKNFHVFSKNQKRVLENKARNKNILFAPLALKDYGVSQEKPEDIVTFLNFGIIRDYKRVDVLIKAANRVYEQTSKKFIVKIAGACMDWSKYDVLIKYPFLFELQIKSIPNEEIADLFSKSHYFVLPYQDIAQSGALTVALNYNIPIIASDLDSFREFIEHEKTGFLFKSASVEELTDIMVYILENHEIIYSELKCNQAGFVKENYLIESIVSRYSDYFNLFNHGN